jgi:hypothetical protein
MKNYKKLTILALALIGIVAGAKTSNAQEAFNVLFTSNQTYAVDAALIYWSTNKEADCSVQYSKNADMSQSLTAVGEFTPMSNSQNGGRYHFATSLNDLDRNKTYYFRINCSSKREVNVNASSDVLSFLSSVGFFDRPDLTVSDVYFNPMPIKGRLYTGALNVVVKNIGNKDAELPEGIEVAVSAINGNTGGMHPLVCDVCDTRSWIGRVSTNRLAVGETRTITFNLVNNPFNFDTFNVRASIDHVSARSSGDLAEMEEGNNLFTKDFRISAPPQPPVPVQKVSTPTPIIKTPPPATPPTKKINTPKTTPVRVASSSKATLGTTTATTTIATSSVPLVNATATTETPIPSSNIPWYVKLWKFIWRF